MARINICVPALGEKVFTGGMWCIMQYADGLAKRGHDVQVVPALPSPIPGWHQGEYRVKTISKRELQEAVRIELINATQISCNYLLNRATKHRVKDRLGALTYALALYGHKALSYEVRRAVSLTYLSEILDDADFTIATSYETALAAHLYGTGKRFYFMQHYEPYFKNEADNPHLAEIEALLSYKLGLNLIANSTWLKNKLESDVQGSMVAICGNAIDHEVFNGKPKTNLDRQEVKIISYGGRNAVWKGFKEMAEAVRIARTRLPDVNLVWMVYGEALLPPENPIAEYKSLGFLRPKELADAYRCSDILLSASWYESFPLFPIEAMACGLPIVTTQYGTEDYAIHGETAEIVEPRNPESIADGLVKLINNPSYAMEIARKGHLISHNFTWDRSIAQMETILLS